MKVEFVRTRALHVRSVARRMREADRREVQAAAGIDPFKALAHSVRRSDMSYTAMMGGVPIAVFGVGPINVLGGVGSIWLLGTDEVDRVSTTLLRSTRRWKPQLLSRYRVLRNFVSVDNRASIRLLVWLGATFSAPMEIMGHSFRMFEIRADEDVR